MEQERSNDSSLGSSAARNKPNRQPSDQTRTPTRRMLLKGTRIPFILASMLILAFCVLSLHNKSKEESLPACLLRRLLRVSNAFRANHNQQCSIQRLPTTPPELAALNQELGDGFEKIMNWTLSHFAPTQVFQLTSFGPTGMVLLDRLQSTRSIPVVTIDTLHLFPETYQHVNNVRGHYPEVTVHTYRPLGFDDCQAFDKAWGADLYTKDPAHYARLTKVDSLERAQRELSVGVWLTGRRKDQGRNVVAVEYVDGLYKVNPMVGWSYDQIWNYLQQRNIPYNALHDRGYKSVGDMQTTVPVAADASERSGRFVGLSQGGECGLHDTWWKKEESSAKDEESKEDTTSQQ